MRSYTAIRGLIAAVLGIAAASCGSSGTNDDEPSCLSHAVSTDDCTPLYEPTFDNVFKNTLSTTCAAPGCHSGSQPEAGMALDDIDRAYTNLLAKSTTGGPRITPGDVRCGKVIVRLESKDKSYSMPPLTPLPDNQLCSIVQWIANGAMR
jgi:hypothetical protein